MSPAGPYTRRIGWFISASHSLMNGLPCTVRQLRRIQIHIVRLKKGQKQPGPAPEFVSHSDLLGGFWSTIWARNF
jgi:hypothetical protein